MVLNDVSYDAILIKVTSPPLSPKVLLKADLHIADVEAIPPGVKDGVGKTHHQQVLQQQQKQADSSSANVS